MHIGYLYGLVKPKNNSYGTLGSHHNGKCHLETKFTLISNTCGKVLK
jgi:hypothetical protein